MTAEHDMPALSPVTSTTRRDVVVTAIRRAVLTGELAPGQRIKEVSLADSLGVSRPTVREAMNQLVHEGALVQEPYKGVKVAEPTPQDLLDVAEVRVSLETLAALRLSRDPDGDGMRRLRKALRTHLDAIADADPVRADLTHVELHQTLWEASGNQMLSKFWPLIAPQVQMAMTLDQATRADPERDAELHRRLINVIASGDEDAIIAEVREHIGRSADEVAALVAEKSH